MLFVIFLYLLHFVSSENTPTIIESSTNVIKDVNESVTIYCKVKDLQDYSIVWSKQILKGSITIAADDKRIVRDPRINVTLNRNSQFADYRLTINNLQHKDAGEYHCSISLDTTEEKSQKITLQVRAPPYIHGDSSTTITTTTNSSTKLECYATGYPTPDVIWKRENNAILPNGNTEFNGSKLTIDRVQKEHAGNYYCYADNKVGDTVKKRFTLIVQFAPIVKPVKERVGQKLGHDAQLEWKIDSSPAPSVTWYKDNIPISNNQYYETSQKAIDDQYTALLKIKVVEKKLYGHFTCRANNTIGTGYASIEIYETPEKQCSDAVCDSSGHSIVNFLDFKLSFTSVIILMFHWQNM